jgi:acetone carboxylase gamma subunit
MAQRLTEYVGVREQRLVCLSCEADLCAATENYKLWVLQQRSPVTDVPGAGDPEPYALDQTLELRRYYCPGCVIQLDAEVALLGDEPLWDVQLLDTEVVS